MSLPADLPMHSGGHLVVVIETPSGSGNKLKFDTDLGVYRLDRVLPAGSLHLAGECDDAGDVDAHQCRRYHTEI